MTTPTDPTATGVTSANDLTPEAVERRFLAAAWKMIETTGYGRLDYVIEALLEKARIYGTMMDARRTAGC